MTMPWAPHINSPFQVGIIALCAVLAPVAPVLAGLRLWSRSIIRARVKLGDYLIILSCVTLLGLWIPIILCMWRGLASVPEQKGAGPADIWCRPVFAGGGGAEWELKDRGIGFWIMRVECLVIASTFYLVSSYLCRVSILCIYHELLGQLPRMDAVILAVGTLVAACGAASLGVQLGVGIQDIHFVMADLGPDAVQEGSKWVAYGVVPDVLSCACDFAVFAVPLRPLWKLQMRDRRRKVRLLATFTVGFIACLVSLLRILTWKLPGYIGQAPADRYIRRDAFELLYPVEVTFGILGASLPMLRPILHRDEYGDGQRHQQRTRSSGDNSYAMGRVHRSDPSTGASGSMTALNPGSSVGLDSVGGKPGRSKGSSLRHDDEEVGW